MKYDGREWRLTDNYFEVLVDGDWQPSGDSLAKVASLARLAGFVRPEDLTVAEVPAETPPADERATRVALLRERVAWFVDISPRDVAGNLVVRESAMVELAQDIGALEGDR